jgi:hypothetical protein
MITTFCLVIFIISCNGRLVVLNQAPVEEQKLLDYAINDYKKSQGFWKNYKYTSILNDPYPSLVEKGIVVLGFIPSNNPFVVNSTSDLNSFISSCSSINSHLLLIYGDYNQEDTSCVIHEELESRGLLHIVKQGDEINTLPLVLSDDQKLVYFYMFDRDSANIFKVITKDGEVGIEQALER